MCGKMLKVKTTAKWTLQRDMCLSYIFCKLLNRSNHLCCLGHIVWKVLPIVTDLVWSVRWSVTIMSCAKTA